MKGRWRFQPGKQVDSKGQVAFLKCFPEYIQLSRVARLGKGNEVQVRIRPGVALYPGAVGPHYNAGQVGFQQLLYQAQVIRGQVD